VKPIEEKLLEQFPIMLQQSPEATASKFHQQQQSLSFSDLDLDTFQPNSVSSLASGEDLFSTLTNGAWENMNSVDLTNERFNASCDIDLNSGHAYWDSTTSVQAMTTTSEAAFGDKSACTCSDFCACPVPQNIQLQSPAPSAGMIVSLESLDNDSKIMSMLQSMNKSILTLQRRLESKHPSN